jgi:hypothetical protein
MGRHTRRYFIKTERIKTRKSMLSHFQFSPVIIIWTLTFAALLVLLVVILGRDRAKLYPLFTFSVGVVAFRLLVTRILYGKLSALALTWLFTALALLAALAGILVAVEMARRAFSSAGSRTRTIGTVLALAVAAAVLVYWGPWPSWQTITASGATAHLRLTQLIAQRGDMLASLLAIEVGILALLFGRRYSAGLRSHTFQIIVGLFVAAVSQLSVRAIWQLTAAKAVIHTQADYEKIIAYQGKLNNANNIVYIVVLIWWIVCLWNDEPTSALASITDPAVPVLGEGTEELEG